MSAVRY